MYYSTTTHNKLTRSEHCRNCICSHWCHSTTTETFANMSALIGAPVIPPGFSNLICLRFIWILWIFYFMQFHLGLLPPSQRQFLQPLLLQQCRKRICCYKSKKFWYYFSLKVLSKFTNCMTTNFVTNLPILLPNKKICCNNATKSLLEESNCFYLLFSFLDVNHQLTLRQLFLI